MFDKYIFANICSLLTSVWILTRSQHSTQLSSYVRKILKSLDNSGVSGMLLTDLSKTFGCVRHDLLIAKLSVYGLNNHQNTEDRTQKTKVNKYQFNCCSLVWMFHCGKLNNNINRERLELHIRIMNPRFLNYYEKITM